MLPAPITLATRRTFRRNAGIPRRKVIDVLLTRARATNLALLLLASFATLSFLLNLKYYFSSSLPSLGPVSEQPPLSILETLSRDKNVEDLNHLIIVPGHAIWKGINPDLRMNEDEWVLSEYQRGGGRVATFFNHIEKGAQIAGQDERSLVIFSGGQTHSTSTTTEAESYMRLALAANVLQMHPSQSFFPRATTEDYALDSFQNLLFSIARFNEYTGRYPEKITVVGYEMKRRRFTDLHRAALRWPRENFHYIGIDAEVEGLQAQQGEFQNGYLPYTLDSYGCHSFLRSKRQQRNPFTRFHPYFTSAIELRGLLNWCPGSAEGKNTIFSGNLPWDRQYR